MKRLLSLLWRGCRPFPHLGPHPGVAPLVFAVIGAPAIVIVRGAIRGSVNWWDVLAVFAMMTAVFGFLFLYGAYERALWVEAKENGELDDW